MEKMIQISYDKTGDVLYLSVGDPRPAISEEIGDDVLLRLDVDTGELVGLTMLNFSQRFSEAHTAENVPVGIELHRIGEN